MKMNKKYYELFTEFYNNVVENANDADICFIMNAIKEALEREAKSRTNNNGIEPHNKKLIRDFFEDFLFNANNDDAIYLIEVIKSACKKVTNDPNGVAKFVKAKKEESKNK